jgi:hypothetical protein
MMNPTLADLIGGIQSVTLSDEEARRRGTQKSILERKAPPTFDTIIEIVDRDQVAVHQDVASTVDIILRGAVPRPEFRRREEDGGVAITIAPRIDQLTQRENGRSSSRGGGRGPSVILDFASDRPGAANAFAPVGGNEQTTAPTPVRGRGTEARPVRIYAFGVSRNRLEQAINLLRVPASVVRDPRDADIVLTLKNYYRQKAQPIRDAEARGTPVYVLRSNTSTQMEQLLGSIFPARTPGSRTQSEVWPDAESAGVEPISFPESDDPLLSAISEAEEAIAAVMDGGAPVQLAPQGTRIRQIQHQLAERYAVSSRSRGREPNRRVEISRDGSG